MLLVTLALAYRTNLTERQLVALFGPSQSSVDRAVRDLHARLLHQVSELAAERPAG